jgi:antibiotic biosynthesis monooxygenase (ABM) superfamily enzyme
MAQVHIAITRQVKPGMERAFEDALREFARESLSAPGTTGVHMIGPVSGTNHGEYGILRSFESEPACQAFYDSEMFRRWDEKASQFVIGGWTRRKLHGLEEFFRDVPGEPPPKWKMAVVTWLGVFPAVLLWSWVLSKLLSGLPSLVITGIVSAFVVATLAWIAMPLLTRLFSTWLSSPRRNVGD